MATGDRIRSIRKSRNLTQKQLGELAGIAEPTIRRYELGKLNPKYETLVKIAAALKTSVGALRSDGTSIKYKVTQWKSRKDARLEIDIDSALLTTLQAFASANNMTLGDATEQLLLEYTDILAESE